MIWRKFRYPFKSALAISNDIDDLSFRDFAETHRFLNTKDMTPFGMGVDLDISDSFWFYNARSEMNDAVSYFEGLTDKPSRYSVPIRRLVELGYLDTLHTWGDFSEKGGFVRSMGEVASREMKTWRRMPIVWTDHGDELNSQNLGSAEGVRNIDLPGEAGISFVWKGDTTAVWGQERQVSARERAWSYFARAGLLRRSSAWLKSLSQRTAYDSLLKDGTTILSFQRYLIDWSHAGLNDLPAILAPQRLDLLEKRESAAVILVHFGFSGDGDPGAWVTALRDLAGRYQRGRIDVVSTERMLLQCFARAHLCVNQQQNAIDLSWPEAIPSGIRGRDAEALEGLTLYVEKPASTSVRFGGKPINFSVNPPDETGRASVTLNTRTRPPFPYNELVPFFLESR